MRYHLFFTIRLGCHNLHEIQMEYLFLLNCHGQNFIKSSHRQLQDIWLNWSPHHHMLIWHSARKSTLKIWALWSAKFRIRWYPSYFIRLFENLRYWCNEPISFPITLFRSKYNVNQSFVKQIYVLTSYTYFSYLAKVEGKFGFEIGHVSVASIIISLNAGVIHSVIIVNFKPCYFLADEKEDSLP